MGDFSQSPAFGIPAALATAGGAALLSRGGTLGTPLGIALAGLGGYGLDYASNKAKQKQQQSLAEALRQINPGTGPAEPRNVALANLIGAGWSPADAEAALKMPEAKKTLFAKPGEPVGLINESDNTFTPTKGLSSLPAAQKQQSEFDQFRNAPENKGLTYSQAVAKYKSLGRAPEKPEKPAVFFDPKGNAYAYDYATGKATPIVLPGGAKAAKGAPKPTPAFKPPPTTIRKGATNYKLDIGPSGALVYKALSAPGGIRGFFSGPVDEELPGPILPGNVKPYRRSDGTIGFAVPAGA